MLTPKPRDQNGDTLPHDHEGIVEDNFLIRAITQHYIKDGRISSAAFKSSTDPYKGLSIDLAQINDQRNYLQGTLLGAVKIFARIPRAKSLIVGYDPIEDNSAHGQIWRFDGSSKDISRGSRKYMQKNCCWHVKIPDVNIA